MLRTDGRVGARERRAMTFLAVVLLHALAIRAFWLDLATSRVRPEPTTLEIQMIQPERRWEPLPPMPPLRLMPPPVNFHPPLSAIQIAAPESPAAAEPSPPLQVETIPTEVAPPPPQASAPAPRSNAKPKAIYVPGGWQRYPEESIRAKETGAPTITICVSAAGVVDSVQVAESSGFPRLDQAAVGIGREARFKPALLDGRPVPLCLPYRVKFDFLHF
jgi:protein TonB